MTPDELVAVAREIDARSRAPQKTAPAHVRVIDVRGGRRINDRQGRSHNLCGAEPTSYDVIYADAVRLGAADRERWIDCLACRAKLPAVKK